MSSQFLRLKLSNSLFNHFVYADLDFVVFLFVVCQLIDSLFAQIILFA